MFKDISLLKYKIARWIERYPLLSIFIYNNSQKLSFFLPHEKDYHGIPKICKNSKKYSIVDVGANIGISTLGFRKLGLSNPIYLFEPNFFLYEKYLINLKKKIQNIFIFNLALNNIKRERKLYVAHYKNTSIHFLSSFNKNYILNSIKITYSNLINKMSIIKKNVKCDKFDSLKIKYPPKFIKLDTEGHDYKVLVGMRKTIKKYEPTFLIEYNVQIFKKICKFLKSYKPYIYDYKKNKFLDIYKIDKRKISRTSKYSLLTNRNVFFIPKKTKLN